MFICDCPTCGARELRGPRSLATREGTWYTRCRPCGAEVRLLTAPIAATRAA